jgi:hypothetical protein
MGGRKGGREGTGGHHKRCLALNAALFIPEIFLYYGQNYVFMT